MMLAMTEWWNIVQYVTVITSDFNKLLKVMERYEIEIEKSLECQKWFILSIPLCGQCLSLYFLSSYMYFEQINWAGYQVFEWGYADWFFKRINWSLFIDE